MPTTLYKQRKIMKKAIKGLLVSFLVVVVLVSAGILGGYLYVKNTYDIDIFKTIKEINILTESVDENVLCPHAFGDEDMVDVQGVVNASVEDFITYSEENGYVVNFNDLPDEMKYIIRLTDKQVGAFADTVVKQEINGQINVEDKAIGIELKQVKFSSATENSVLINAIVMVDMSTLKAEIPDKFPINSLAKKVPDKLYISSTVRVDKGATAFSYTVHHHGLTINNLNAEETADLFHTLDVILKVGSAENWNVNIGTAIANALIGNEENNGLAYSLKDIGATDYEFVEDGGNYYFYVLR